MTGPEVTAAMKPEEVPADLAEKAAKAAYAMHYEEARAWHEAEYGLPLDEEDWPVWDPQDDHFSEMLREQRHALAAVLPEVQAQAHDEGKRMVLTMAGLKDVNWPNPYRETEHVTVTAEVAVCDPWAACPEHGDQHWREYVENARAEAWEACAREAHERGWTHDFGRDDLLARNPHRAARLTATTEETTTAIQRAARDKGWKP